MDIPPGEQPPSWQLLLQILPLEPPAFDWPTMVFILVGIVILLCLSGLFSASETAFFSLGPQEIRRIKNREDKVSQTIISLLYNHRRLLAVILIANNFVNVCIIFLSTYLFTRGFIYIGHSEALRFLVQVVLVTFIIVMFGEILPKAYATRHQARIARAMAMPLLYLTKILKPFVLALEKTGQIIDRRVEKKGHQVSLDDINQAIDITTDGSNSEEEKDILKGIVNFGSIPVKQIMRSRLDVSALAVDTPFKEVLEKVREWGYSRLPVYEENFDSIKGILYIKDLVPHIRQADFQWQDVIRKPYFVPETKKLDDLMKDFQEKRVHMAIVVDEYGGSSGLVTMEDVMEEVFGDIQDEFDDDDFVYSHLDDHTYVFEGKSLLHDICRTLGLDIAVFEEIKGDADTLGGMLMEMQGKIPNIGSRIRYKEFEFVIESADRRRIKRVKMMLPKEFKRGEEES